MVAYEAEEHRDQHFSAVGLDSGRGELSSCEHAGPTRMRVPLGVSGPIQ